MLRIPWTARRTERSPPWRLVRSLVWLDKLSAIRSDTQPLPTVYRLAEGRQQWRVIMNVTTCQPWRNRTKPARHRAFEFTFWCVVTIGQNCYLGVSDTIHAIWSSGWWLSKLDSVSRIVNETQESRFRSGLYLWISVNHESNLNPYLLIIVTLSYQIYSEISSAAPVLQRKSVPGIGKVKHVVRKLEKMEMVSLIINIIVDLNSRSEELFLFIKLINIEILYKSCKGLRVSSRKYLG